MKQQLLLSAVLALSVEGSSGETPAIGEPLDLCRFNLVWSDEFNDLSVSPWRLEGKRWIAHTPWAGDFGDAKFADPGPGGPFAVRNGKLHITARKDRKGNWTSGLLAAADETGAGNGIQYGYFEARMRMPRGPGTWPAFWLMPLKPRSDPEPSVELDGIEYYGHDPASYQAAWHVHFKPPEEDRKRGDLTRIPIKPRSFTRGFHTVGILVTPETVTYMHDRVPVWSHPTPPELKTPLYPLVNLALGSGYPIDKTPNPSVLVVDYVRIYAPAAANAPTTCPDADND